MFDFDLVEMVENNMEQKQNTVPPVDEFKGNPIGLVPPSLAAFSAVIIAAVFHFYSFPQQKNSWFSQALHN
jgi:hypothetical protein